MKIKISALPILSITLFVLLIIFFVKYPRGFFRKQQGNTQAGFQQTLAPTGSLEPTPTPSPTPAPTPKPLTFNEMNQLYGPCVRLPVIMYHHVQDPAVAKENGQTNISVSTSVFENQMAYLSQKGYLTVNPASIDDFFDKSTSLSGKLIVITFDDGYGDFYTNAYPILSKYGFSATVFVITGLVENPGYLNWSQINQMASSNIFFANHTWSHKSVGSGNSAAQNEISTADTQLGQYGLNNPKTFAYPYGTVGSVAYLQQLGYTLAFSTYSGSTLCKQQRFNLPRIRIGNSPMSAYGF